MPRRRNPSTRPEVVAHRLVAEALREGRMVRPTTCESCGQTPPPSTKKGLASIVLHHWRGYEGDAATDVEALCRRCHNLIHYGKLPEPRTGKIREDAFGPRRGPWSDAALARTAVIDHMIRGGRLPPYMRQSRYAEVASTVTDADLSARREQHAEWAKWRQQRNTAGA